jgi:phenylalanyl-tRNA synthetase alpha chain
MYIHPITGTIREIVSIFSDMGFSVADGPEIEDEWHNFDALNVPKDHPARDMQDTFWLPDLPAPQSEAARQTGRRVMRTHTSPVQIRWMEENEPPIRIIVPGKVYRNEATDMTHEAQFYQVEGLVIDTDVTLAHLKGTLENFFSSFFKGSVEIRFRPSYFPFVEPGVEVDMRITGDTISEKLRDKWIEIMGAGMVHPNVLNAVKINPKKYQGFAFGVGIERLAMLRWGIDDARIFHTGDLRFVQQFKAGK